MGRRLTLEIVKERLKEINPSIEVLSDEYVNNNTKLQCRCKKCGHMFDMKWGHLQQGHGCKQCSIQQRSDNLRYDIYEIKKRLLAINKNIAILSDLYTNNLTKLKCKCLIDGHVWYTNWANLSQGYGCSKCAGIVAPTIEYIQDFVNQSHPNILITSEYKSKYSPIDCKCTECNINWTTTWSSLRQGCGCPNCANELRGFTLTSWMSRAEKSKCFNSFKLYILECYSNSEVFYKIGITYTTVEERYSSKHSMPYEYRIVKIIEHQSAKYIWDLEKSIHNSHRFKGLSYVPKVCFGGSSTECFSALIREEVDKLG